MVNEEKVEATTSGSVETYAGLSPSAAAASPSAGGLPSAVVGLAESPRLNWLSCKSRNLSAHEEFEVNKWFSYIWSESLALGGLNPVGSGGRHCVLCLEDV